MALTYEQFQQLRAKGLSPQQIAGFESKQASAFPTAQPEEQKSSFMSRLSGLVKSVGSALTTSEQKFGQALSTVVDKNTLNTVDQTTKTEQDSQRSIIDAIQKETDPAKKQRLTDFLKANYTDYQAPTATDINPAFGMSNKEVLGAAAGTALDVVTAGALNKAAQSGKILKAAAPVAQAVDNLTTAGKVVKTIKNTAKASAVGGTIGYGYDVANKLQDDESFSEAIKPGWGTALGAAIPLAFGARAIQKLGSKELATRINNSLIKPLLKDFRYGKNPGKTIAEMGLVANSQDELVTVLRTAKQQVGEQLGQVAKNLEQQISQANPVAIDLTKALSPLDDAIKQAATNNDQTLINRIEQVKKALTQKLEAGLDEAGNTVIQSVGERELVGGFDNALSLKRLVGSLTKWTGNPTEDKLINKALKEIYSSIDNTMLAEARKASPELASQFEKLNGQYADLLTGEIAAKHTYELTQRQNLVGLPVKVGTVTGVITALATGGAAVPAILAGIGAGALEKALSSTPVKTRVAAWLAKESPGVIEKLVQKNPKLKDVLYNTFVKENDLVDKKVLETIKNIKTKGIPVGLSVEMRGANQLKAQELGKKINELNDRWVNKPTIANKKALDNAKALYKKLISK